MSEQGSDISGFEAWGVSVVNAECGQRSGEWNVICRAEWPCDKRRESFRASLAAYIGTSKRPAKVSKPRRQTCRLCCFLHCMHSVLRGRVLMQVCSTSADITSQDCTDDLLPGALVVRKVCNHTGVLSVSACRCLAEEVWVQPLAGRFLRLVLQLLSRFCSWLSEGLEARAAAAIPTAVGNGDAAADGWAIGMRPDQLCSLRIDIEKLLGWLGSSYSNQLVLMLPSTSKEVC